MIEFIQSLRPAYEIYKKTLVFQLTPEQSAQLQNVHREIFGRNLPNCSTCVIESVFSLLIWADHKKAIELAQLADDEQKPKRRRKNEQ
jgi:hypothetical protein